MSYPQDVAEHKQFEKNSISTDLWAKINFCLEKTHSPTGLTKNPEKQQLLRTQKKQWAAKWKTNALF